jgi:hypothetical protein
MMSGYKIWRVINGKVMFWIEKPVLCEICHEELSVEAIHVLDWTRQGLYEHLFHVKCRKSWKHHPLSVVPEIKMVFVCDQRPPGAVLLTPRPPLVCACNRAEAMMFDTRRLLEMPAEHIKDSTKYSFTIDSIEGSTISDCAINYCKEVDRALSTQEGLLHLDMIAHAKPLLTYEEKKLLGGSDAR